MKKTKKLLACLLSMAMISTGLSAFADNTIDETSVAGNVISDSVWNRSIVGVGSEEAYEEFPVLISKSIYGDMQMALTFQYLKMVSESNTASITIRDIETDEILIEKTFTEEDGSVSLGDMAIGKHFLIEVYEETDGVPKGYTAVVNTKYVAADFPVNVVIGENTINNNRSEEAFSFVAIKKVGDHPVCNHEEDEPCVETCDLAYYIRHIMPDELGTFYNTLDDNAFYEMQISVSGQDKEIYKAFISTYEGGEDLGVFEPGYEIYLDTGENTASMQEDVLGNISLAQASIMSSDYTKDDFDFSEYYDYERYINVKRSLDRTAQYYVIRWVVPETGSYTIETIGNLDTQFCEFSVLSNGQIENIPMVRRSGGTGNNARTTMSIVEGQTKYFVLQLEDYPAGDCYFRIVRNSYSNSDDFVNFRDQLQPLCDAGTYSNPMNPDCYIDYDGDRDVFAYNVSKGHAALKFKYVQTPLRAYVCTVYGDRVGDIDQIWDECSYMIGTVGYQGITENFTTTSKGVRYIKIDQQTLPVVGSDEYFNANSYGYDFEFYDPMHKDPEEALANSRFGNDTPLFTTPITEAEYYNSDVTLHAGDTDYFSFNSGPDGKGVKIQISKVRSDVSGIQYLYIPTLYDAEEYTISTTTDSSGEINSITWDEPSPLAQFELVDGMTQIEYNNLEKNHNYIIKVNYSNTAYSPVYPYTIGVEIIAPRSVLSEDVTLTHEHGTDIINTTDFRGQIMDSITCYNYGVKISKSIAKYDVTLHYNGEELTADVVNSLPGGSYPIDVRYKGVSTTGGTVTLVVTDESNPPLDNIIEIDNIEMESIQFDSMDWIAVARMLANVRLARENKGVSEKSIMQGLADLRTNDNMLIRATLAETAKAAGYFYTNGAEYTSFYFAGSTISATHFSTTMKNLLSEGKVIGIQLVSTSDTNDMSLARYVVICGMNVDNNTYKVMDPVGERTMWIEESVLLNGGYDSNADLKFSGAIVEFM